MIFEVCVDSVEGAVAAQTAGAQRVELCDNLVEGGTTPSLGMLSVTRKAMDISIHALIRPRGGDFYYSPAEMEVMKQDIFAAKHAGANGVVLGALAVNGSVDVEKTRMLVQAARPLSITFHRAFDLCRDPFEALEVICGLGIERILTSGQKADALQGADTIARLVKQAAGRVGIIAGGGITPENVRAVRMQTGVGEVHFSARKSTTSPMEFQNRECFMGKAYQPDEYMRKVPDVQRIWDMIENAG